MKIALVFTVVAAVTMTAGVAKATDPKVCTDTLAGIAQTLQTAEKVRDTLGIKPGEAVPDNIDPTLREGIDKVYSGPEHAMMLDMNAAMLSLYRVSQDTIGRLQIAKSVFEACAAKK